MLFRILKDIFFPKKEILNFRQPQAVASPFIRDDAVPSILVLTHSYQGNGAAVMLMFLLEWLVKIQGWQVQALTTGLTDGDKEALTNIGVGLVDAVNPEQYDFAVCNTVVSGLNYIEKFCNYLPCLLWVHEGEFVLWNSRMALGDWKRIINLSKHIVFQTNWQAEHIFGSFISNISSSRYSVIPNCLPEINFTSNNKKIATSNKKRIVFIGGVYDRKRPFDLVQAALKLKQKDIECLFVGTTDHITPEMRSIIEKDARFQLTGEISHAATTDILASADVLVLPSSDESQPLVLLEAAHLNVPVIISDLPVYRGIWTNGVNCLMHAVGDIDCLAKHLETALAGRAPKPLLPSGEDFSQATFFDHFDKVFCKLLPESLKTYGK